MVILSNRKYQSLLSRIERLERVVQMQGTAHSAIMEQGAATQQIVREEAKKLNERLSFNRRPQP